MDVKGSEKVRVSPGVWPGKQHLLVWGHWGEVGTVDGMAAEEVEQVLSPGCRPWSVLSGKGSQQNLDGKIVAKDPEWSSAPHFPKLDAKGENDSGSLAKTLCCLTCSPLTKERAENLSLGRPRRDEAKGQIREQGIGCVAWVVVAGRASMIT